MLVYLDDHGRTAQLNLRALDLLTQLQEDEHHAIEAGCGARALRTRCGGRPVLMRTRATVRESAAGPSPSRRTSVATLWRPEYGRYMIEGTPGLPYGSTARDLLAVEGNMVLRRQQVRRLLRPGERLVTLTVFPRLGCPRFLHPHAEPRGEASHSLFIPDEAINTHPRFRYVVGGAALRARM